MFAVFDLKSLLTFLGQPAASFKTQASRSGLSLERQKDFYDKIIIPAAYETISDPVHKRFLNLTTLSMQNPVHSKRSLVPAVGCRKMRAVPFSSVIHFQLKISLSSGKLLLRR